MPSARLANICSHMAHSPEVISEVRRLRRERSLTLDQLADRFSIPRSTIQRWIADLSHGEVGVSGLDQEARKQGNLRMRENRRELRRWAYVEGLETYLAFREASGFREFVTLCLSASGRLGSGVISCTSADPALIANQVRWFDLLGANEPRFRLRSLAGADPVRCRDAWADGLGVEPDRIKIRASLPGSGPDPAVAPIGVMTVRVEDRLLCRVVEACGDCLRDEWKRVN